MSQHQHRHLRGVDAPDRAHTGGTQAVILAGGRGTRLAPYTSVLPKPLMPIGERTILETVVEQLEEHGFTDITFCVGYLSHLIRAVFDTRGGASARISYVHEETPLGTAAPLRLVDGLDETFLMMNGDVLTTLDYRDLVRHHQASGNLFTVATRKRKIKIDYGVIHEDSHDGSSLVVGWEEKPEVVTSVSMGIYVVEPAALDYLPAERHFDVPELVSALLAAGERVGTYRHDGAWFDIGRQEDYHQAVAAWLEAQERPAETADAPHVVTAHAPAAARSYEAAHARRRGVRSGKLIR